MLWTLQAGACVTRVHKEMVLEKALCDSLGLKKCITIIWQAQIMAGPHSTELWIPDLFQGAGQSVSGYCAGERETQALELAGQSYSIHLQIFINPRISLKSSFTLNLSIAFCKGEERTSLWLNISSHETKHWKGAESIIDFLTGYKILKDGKVLNLIFRYPSEAMSIGLQDQWNNIT